MLDGANILDVFFDLLLCARSRLTWHAADMTSESEPPETIMPGTFHQLIAIGVIDTTKPATNKANRPDAEYPPAINASRETPALSSVSDGVCT